MALNPVPVSQKETILDFVLPEYTIDWNYWELYSLCSKIQAPCGFEVAAGDEKYSVGDDAPPNREAVRFPGPITVREVLDKITERRARYRWTYDRGVINLLPKAGEGLSEEGLSPGGRNPLDRVIADLSFKGLRAHAAADVILAASLGGAESIPPGRLSEYKELEMNLRSITVRDALNEVARTDGKVMWIFCRDPHSGEWLRGIIGWRTAPLR